MIPLGPEHINRIARCVEEVTNLRHLLRGRGFPSDLEERKRDARASDRFASYAPGELVRIKDIKPGPALFGDRPSSGPGLAQVLIEPLHDDGGPTRRVFYACANELELVDDAAPFLVGPGRVVEAPDGRFHFMTDVYAQRLHHAHADVAEAYKTLSYALNNLKAIEKETAR